MQAQAADTQRYSDRVVYLQSVLFGYKLNLELLDRESRTTECSCCGVDCYSDGSHSQWYCDDGIVCRYSEV